MSWSRLERWVQEAYHVSPQGLALYRMSFAAHLVMLTLVEYVRAASWLPQMPAALYYPPLGPMVLSPGLPSEGVMWVMITILTLASLALFVGYRTSLASVLIGACIMALDASLYSLGKIDHGRVLISVLPWIMSLSGWGQAWSVDSRRGLAKRDAELDPSWPLSLLAVVVGFGLMSAGLPKLLGGWLDWSTQASYAKTYTNCLQLGRDKLLALFAIRHPHRVIWEVLDWATVFFELGFLLAVPWRRVFRVFLLLAVCFHWGVLLTMNIPFPEQMIVYAAFLPWSALAKHPRFIALSEGVSAHPRSAVLCVMVLSALIQGFLAPLMLAGVSVITWLLYVTAGGVVVITLFVALRRARVLLRDVDAAAL